MRALVLDRTTGEEIRLKQMFSDADAAFDAMETIIENDVLSQLSDYMEYSELLPMPRDNYAIDAYGLTVFYPDDSYRYFDEQSGAVQFAWYELADYIGEDSPAYALAHGQGDMNALADAAQNGQIARADGARCHWAEARRSAFSLHAADRSGLYEGFTGVSV